MNILFVCQGNVGRSQMAEAFFNFYSRVHRAYSAGANGQKYSHKILGEDRFGKHIVDCMNERGIGIKGNRPKQLTKEMIRECDAVIWMGDEDYRGYVQDKELYVWNVDDPHHFNYERTIKIRDDIEDRVKDLVDKLDNSKPI